MWHFQMRERMALMRGIKTQGHLGGSVSWVSDFSSDHVLAVCEFEPRVGLCADSSQPGACFKFVSPFLSLSAPPQLTLSLSLSKINER